MLNKNLGIRKNDRILLSEHYIQLFQGQIANNSGVYTADDEDFYSNGEIAVFDGMNVILGNNTNEIYEICDTSPAEFSFRLKDKEGNYYNTDITQVHLRIPSYSRYYTVKEFENGTSDENDGASGVNVRDENDGRFSLYDGSKKVLLSAGDLSCLKLTRATEKPVRCILKTSVTDLGTSLYKKDLYGISFVFPEVNGEVKYGYETSENEKTESGKIRKSGIFNSTSFDGLSFADSFAKSVFRKCSEKNFNYIVFSVASEDGNGFSVGSICAVYSIKKNLIKGYVND